MAAAPSLGAAGLDALAERVAAGWPGHAILGESGRHLGEDGAGLLAALDSDGVPRTEAAAYLRGLAAGLRSAASSVTAEAVWSGPASNAVPVRATAQALLEVIAEAAQELVLMTYSAKPHDGIRAALEASVDRGVAVSVVVETLQGAGGALSGAEPAAAFARIPGVRLWHWPSRLRTEQYSKTHAKLAVADRRVLLVSSANLTQSGVAANIEAGLLLRGGTAPQRTAEHIAELKARGVLEPLREGDR
ncbi:hypothetical protein GCM10027294_51070 [Marinactinospora endophytica]